MADPINASNSLTKLVMDTVDVIGVQNVPIWMKWLALMGGLWLLQTVGKTGMQFVYIGVYIFGFFKFIYEWVIEKYAKTKNRSSIEKVSETSD